MLAVFMKSHRYWRNKHKVNILGNKTFCTVPYVQGQSPERKIREYFYYIDHQGMVSNKLHLDVN